MVSPPMPQRLAAGGQQVHLRATPHDGVGGLGAAADQVLAVVQHDQHVLGGQGIEQRVQGGLARLASRSPAPRRWPRPPRPGSVTAASSTSQTPSPDPSSSSAATCRPSRVLPAPPAPVKRDQPADSTRARTSASSRSRPMNVASWAGRLFGSAGLPSDRSGGNSARRPGALQLEDLLRAAQVFQPVRAQIAQRRARRQRIADQRGRRLRHQDLAAVRDRRDPGGAMHIQAHQARRPSPPPHRNARPSAPGPAHPPGQRMRLQRLLHLQHRRHAAPAARRTPRRTRPPGVSTSRPACAASADRISA